MYWETLSECICQVKAASWGVSQRLLGLLTINKSEYKHMVSDNFTESLITHHKIKDLSEIFEVRLGSLNLTQPMRRCREPPRCFAAIAAITAYRLVLCWGG